MTPSVEPQPIRVTSAFGGTFELRRGQILEGQVHLLHALFGILRRMAQLQKTSLMRMPSSSCSSVAAT